MIFMAGRGSRRQKHGQGREARRETSEGFFASGLLQDVIGGVAGFYLLGNGNVSFCQRAIPDLVTALSISNFLASHIREQSSDLP